MTGSLIQGCVWNTSSNDFSASFSTRRNSCIFDKVGNGFWRDPRYIFHANLSDIRILKSVGNISQCAFACSTTTGCSAIDFNSSTKICKIKTGSPLYACDPQQTGCSLLQTGFYGAPGFYFTDSNDLYCTALSEDCACSREYYNCMLSSGCVGQSDLAVYSQSCANKGCTAIQCGLATPVCNVSSRCNENYLTCSTAVAASNTVGSGCFCIRNMTKCLQDSNCLFYADDDSSLLTNSLAVSANQIYDWYPAHKLFFLGVRG